MSKVLPQQFGKYILMRRIAVGGMAEIFKAKMTGTEGFEKDLVIKRILPHFSEDESFVRMFIDEASITAKLQHQNIVQIFDFDVIDGAYYIAMEYIEGNDLKDVLERSIELRDPLSVAQCVWILMEVSKGLHYAHVKDYRGKPLNIVHRDISPSNVMVAFNGEVKLMDFGIAKAAQRSTKTMAGAVKGKVAYMSPEQARGKPLDGRSDLFALGIMLWEMLTGKRLFLAISDFETLTNVLKAEAPAPSRLNPAVPADLDPIVLKCLEKKREDRYPSVEAFNRELTRWYYSNVLDLEKEKLRPLLTRLFAKEIAQLDRHGEAERHFMGQTSSHSGGGTNAGESTQMISATGVLPAPPAQGPTTGQDQKTRLNTAAMRDAVPDPPGPDERTRSLPVSHTSERPQPSQAPQPHDATRTLDRFDEPPAAPIAPAPQPNDATRTIEQFDTPAPQPAAPAPARRRGRAVWITLLVLLFLGGGGATAYYFSQSGAASTTVAPSAPSTDRPATLTVVTDPSAAEVTLDGVDTRRLEGTAIGRRVNVEVRAPGFEPYIESVRVDEADQVLTIQLAQVARFHELTIRPSDDAAVVYADGERLGTGPQPLRARVGAQVLVRVEPSGGGEAVTQTITVSEATDVVNVAVATPAELLVTVAPATAAIEASVGEVDARGGGEIAITGIEVGASVELTISANGYRTERRTVGVAEPSQSLRIALDRVPVAKGSIVIHAKPWADVAINGKPHGTTPLTLEGIDAGRHRVTMTQGTTTVTKTVTVPAGGTVNVIHDFTAM